MSEALERALRIVAKADSDPARQALFATVRSRSPAIRAATTAHHALGKTPASTALIVGFGLAEFAKASAPRRRAPILSLGIYNTDHPALDAITAAVGARYVTPLTIGARPGARTRTALAGLWRAQGRREFARRVHSFNREHGFLVACRLAATLAWYRRSQLLLRETGALAVLVTSNFHPEPLGLCAAARDVGVPTIFVSHAHPQRLCPALDFDLSILEGQAALDAYEAIGPVRGQVMFRGVEGESRPLELDGLDAHEPVIGLFPPKEIRWERFATSIREARERFRAKRFLIRWHPNMLEGSKLSAVLDDVSDVEITAPSAALGDVANRCDWVLAEESSNVHLGTLKAGVPSIPVADWAVTVGGSDFYGFIREGVIPPACRSLRDLSLADCAAFFGEGWATRFRRFDGAYLRPRAQVDSEIRAKVLAVAGVEGSTP